MLVFSVLCLAVFALITLSSANSAKALTSAELQMTEAYYSTDLLAERVFARLLDTSGTVPVSVLDVSIESDVQGGVLTAEFVCPITGNKELYIKAEFYDDTYKILNWHSRDIVRPYYEDRLPVWTG